MGCVVLQIATISVAMLLGLGCCSSFVGCVPNTQVIITLCNTGVYAKGDPFGTSLDYILEDLEKVAPSRQGYSYRNISPYPNAFAYGQADCNATLSSSDCATCLDAAKTTMLSSCNSRIGARCVLIDCSMRYEQYPFND